MGISKAKSFDRELVFKAWGLEVNGDLGTLATPLATRVHIFAILLLVLRIGEVEKKVMEIILGNLTSALLPRKELLCLLHRSYKFTSDLRVSRWQKLPPDIADEFRSIMLHLPLAVCDLRSRTRAELWATDATPSAGGAVSATVPVKVARAVYRCTEYVGAHLKLSDIPQDQLDSAQAKGM